MQHLVDILGKEILISDNATNGDIIKAIFPNALIENENTHIVDISIGEDSSEIALISAKNKWWNAPYKR